MHEVRLERRPQRVHARLLGKEVPLARVAARAGRQDVSPAVGATAGQRDEVVPRQALPVPQLLLVPAAELAAVVVAGEEERVRDLTAEAAGDVNEFDEADDGGAWDGKSLAMYRRAVRLDDLCLVIDHEPQRPAHGHHSQRLERGVEREAAHGNPPPLPPGEKVAVSLMRTRRPRMLLNPLRRGKTLA